MQMQTNTILKHNNPILCVQKECGFYCIKAVLTIEASLVLPFFLMAMMSLVSIISYIYIYLSVQSIVTEEAKYLSMTSFSGDTLSREQIAVKVLSEIPEGILSSSFIDGVDSFDFSETDVSNPEIVNISVKYDVNFLYDIIPLNKISFDAKAVSHTFIGYINGLSGYDYTNDQYVYITTGTEVYHKSRECTHLKLTIRKTDYKDLKQLRNESGQKYKKCIYCKPKPSDKNIYITSDGDKYHSSLTCSGLKRTVKRVKLSEVTGRRPCLRCGY